MSDQREDDVIDVLKNHLGSDHTRGCQGRCYSCTCGYDTATETILARAETEIASLRAKLESARKALDLYADESNWHFNGRFDPNSSRFNGVRTAQDALTDENGK